MHKRWDWEKFVGFLPVGYDYLPLLYRYNPCKLQRCKGRFPNTSHYRQPNSLDWILKKRNLSCSLCSQALDSLWYRSVGLWYGHWSVPALQCLKCSDTTSKTDSRPWDLLPISQVFHIIEIYASLYSIPQSHNQPCNHLHQSADSEKQKDQSGYKVNQ